MGNAEEEEEEDLVFVVGLGCCALRRDVGVTMKKRSRNKINVHRQASKNYIVSLENHASNLIKLEQMSGAIFGSKRIKTHDQSQPMINNLNNYFVYDNVLVNSIPGVSLWICPCVVKMCRPSWL